MLGMIFLVWLMFGIFRGVFRLGFRLIGLFVGGLMMLMLFGAVLTVGLFRILPLVFFVWLLVRIFTPRRTETM